MADTEENESQQDIFNLGSEYETLSELERRQKVDQALFEAATSGNVAAILQYQTLHPIPQPTLEEQAKKARKKVKNKLRYREAKVTQRELKFLTHYFDCDDCRGKGVKSLQHIGVKGTPNYLASLASRTLQKSKIQEYVKARLEESALPLEMVLKRISDMALASVEFFYDLESDTPTVQLQKAKQAGKLHLIKGLEFFPDRTVKKIHWYDALLACRTLIQAHATLRTIPQKPPVGEAADHPENADTIDTAEEARLRARRAVDFVLQKAKEFHKEMTEAEAAAIAGKWYPEVKDHIVVSQANN